VSEDLNESVVQAFQEQGFEIHDSVMSTEGFVGGLNHQIEHTCFPRISHIHYPGLAPLVEEMCRRHGVQYSVNESLWGALGSHYLFLRRLGREEVLL
jgi:fatty acid desaturase